jgi:hypothetical protein
MVRPPAWRRRVLTPQRDDEERELLVSGRSNLPIRNLSRVTHCCSALSSSDTGAGLVLFLDRDNEPPRLPIQVGARPPYARDATIWLAVELSGAALSDMAIGASPAPPYLGRNGA